MLGARTQHITPDGARGPRRYYGVAPGSKGGRQGRSLRQARLIPRTKLMSIEWRGRRGVYVREEFEKEVKKRKEEKV